MTIHRGTALAAALVLSLTLRAASQEPSSAAAAPPSVTVHATDFAFKAPDQVPAGLTTFHLINDGPGIHHLAIVRLEDGKTVQELGFALRKPTQLPSWAVMIGGPDAVAAETDANATVNLVPGNYALVCFVDVPGGVPHFARGMLRGMTVTASSDPPVVAPPTPDVSVTLSNYAFTLSAPLKAGHRIIEVHALPGQPHEMELIRLAPGKTAEQMEHWIRDMQGPPPGQLVGGIAPIVAGASAYFSVDLTPGTYVLGCFLPDATDGQSHATHGMIKTIKVT